MIPWSNVWETGTGGRAIEFADDGYKVGKKFYSAACHDLFVCLFLFDFRSPHKGA